MTSMALDPDAAAAIAQMAPGLGAVQALDLERLGDDDLRCLIEAAEVADRRLASAQIALLDAADPELYDWIVKDTEPGAAVDAAMIARLRASLQGVASGEGT